MSLLQLLGGGVQQQEGTTVWPSFLQRYVQCAGPTITVGLGGMDNMVTAQRWSGDGSEVRREHIQGYLSIVWVKLRFVLVLTSLIFIPAIVKSVISLTDCMGGSLT